MDQLLQSSLFLAEIDVTGTQVAGDPFKHSIHPDRSSLVMGSNDNIVSHRTLTFSPQGRRYQRPLMDRSNEVVTAFSPDL